MGLITVCIDIVNTTTMVVLFYLFVYGILIQLKYLGPQMFENVGKESQYSLSHTLRLPKQGSGA